MRPKVVIGLLLVAVLGFFFLAPMFYSYSVESGSSLRPTQFTVYRSLGCQLLGFGDEYVSGTAPFPSPMTGLLFTRVEPSGPNGTSIG